jgi:hypothetical protein
MEPFAKKYFTYSIIKTDLHLIKVHNVEATPAIFDEYILFSEVSTRELKGAVIMDISDAKFLSSEQRIRIGDAIKKNTKSIQQNWTSIAYVNTSVLASMVLKGVLLMGPLPVRSKVFTSLDDAIAWSEGFLS